MWGFDNLMSKKLENYANDGKGHRAQTVTGEF